MKVSWALRSKLFLELLSGTSAVATSPLPVPRAPLLSGPAPKRVMVTFASVPANRTSLVYTSTLYSARPSSTFVANQTKPNQSPSFCGIPPGRPRWGTGSACTRTAPRRWRTSGPQGRGPSRPSLRNTPPPGVHRWGVG
eukprot:1182296-Prorocentrum_minimum.AAC.4